MYEYSADGGDGSDGLAEESTINEYLKSNNSSETAIDQLIFEFEKSFFVNKK